MPSYSPSNAATLTRIAAHPALLHAVRATYREQIEFGCPHDTALNLAVIVYLQRHPDAPLQTAQIVVGNLIDAGRDRHSLAG